MSTIHCFEQTLSTGYPLTQSKCAQEKDSTALGPIRDLVRDPRTLEFEAGEEFHLKMKYPIPALGPERRYARPRGEVHLVLVICLDWLSLPRKSVEMTTRQAARFNIFPA